MANREHIGATRSRPVSRRKLLKSGAAAASTAALMSAVRAAFPSGAFAQAAGPEVKKATLGFIALTDFAPLAIAKEKGIFAKYGMPDVEVLKQASWGTTRDNLVLGSEGNGIDGAHILTPMPYLISSGKVTQNNDERSGQGQDFTPRCDQGCGRGDRQRFRGLDSAATVRGQRRA